MPDTRKDLVRLTIGEAPGAEEQLLGKPLVGGSGRWFDNMLRAAGIDRAGLTITNCLSCRPPDNIFPTDSDAKKYITPQDAQAAVAHCRKAHLDPILHGRAWKRIDLLGDKPLRLVGGKSDGVFHWRGSPLVVPGLGSEPKAIATLHPAYCMRDQEMLPAVINDLSKSLEIPPEFYTLFPSLDEVKAFTHEEFAFDIETNGWSREITMVGLCAKPYFAIVVPFRGEYLSELKRIFRNAKSIIGHNIVQFDLPVLSESGVRPAAGAVVWDTMLMQHLCFPSFPHDLEFVGSQFSGKPAWKADKKVFQHYCARDTDVTLQAFRQLKKLVYDNKLGSLYHLIQVPLGRICRLMTDTGFKLNPSRIWEVREKLLGQMAEEEKHLPEQLRTHEIDVNKRQLAPAGTLGKSGKPVKFILVPAKETVTPWRSTTQKTKYLYTSDEPWCLGLPVQFDPKTEKPTTGKNALEKLQRRNPQFARALLALRNLNKWDELVTTFAKQEMVHVDRMHPSFNVHGTASGRLSSSDPNLQNIPESVRFIYVPSHPGWRILEVDYSQIENRLTAFFAGDTERLERFERTAKFSEHKFAASLFLGCKYEEVEKSSDPESDYIKAKKIVHGTNYGEGARRIAKQNDLDEKEVKRLLEIWKRAIGATIRWQNSCAELAKKQGYLETPFGRRRWFYTSSYYTESLSFLPQSTAADIIFRAMVGLMYERIGWPRERALQVARVVEGIPEPARLLLQVHDSLIFEYPPEIEDKLISTVKRVMEQPWLELKGFSCPIGIKTGPSWGEVEEYKSVA